MLSPLQLKGHRFSTVEVHSHPAAVATGKVEVSTRFSCLPVEETPGEWHVTLRVDFGSAKEGNPPPYHGTVEVVGIFAVDSNWPEDKAAELARVNGTSILYGTIRETILSLTARSIHGEFLLPTLSFLKTSPREPAGKTSSQRTPRKAATAGRKKVH